MKNDIAAKIAAALLKEKQDSWRAMTDEEQSAVFKLQVRINVIALRYIDGNVECKSCGGMAYKANKVAGGLASVTSCAGCGSYKAEQTIAP